MFNGEAGRVLATLIRLLGDFYLAEEARQEAFAAALGQWPVQGVPMNPHAWLVQAARNKALDHIRRAATFRSKILHRIAAAEGPAVVVEDDTDEAIFGDDRLRLIFTCCHPALNAEAQIALMLREVCGLTTQAVARAFLVSEETMAQQLDQRIEGVLAVIYAVFTEEYAATAGPRMVDGELCREAIRLGRLLDDLLPGKAAIMGLLALMLLHDARRAARISSAGDVILLEKQDRTLWDQPEISEGLELVDRSLKSHEPLSAYAVEAAIAALHVRASDSASTDWPQIVALYAVLLRLHPSPVVELNRAAAISMVYGPARALELVASLAAREEAKDYHLLHATRGHLLVRLGRPQEALEAYQAALAGTKLDPERRLLAERIAELGGG